MYYGANLSVSGKPKRVGLSRKNSINYSAERTVIRQPENEMQSAENTKTSNYISSPADSFQPLKLDPVFSSSLAIPSVVETIKSDCALTHTDYCDSKGKSSNDNFLIAASKQPKEPSALELSVSTQHIDESNKCFDFNSSSHVLLQPDEEKTVRDELQDDIKASSSSFPVSMFQFILPEESKLSLRYWQVPFEISERYAKVGIKKLYDWQVSLFIFCLLI